METLTVTESLATRENLQYINRGFLNLLFLDKTLNLILKISTRILSNQILLVNNHSLVEESTSVNLKTLDEIGKFISTINIDESLKPSLLKNMLKHFELQTVINTIPTFLHFRGFVILKNVGIKKGSTIITPIVAEAFDFLPNLVPFKLKDFLPNFIQIINDFKTFNTRGYFHQDLQSNCRNISAYTGESETTKLIVYDLDDAKKLSELIENFNAIEEKSISLILKDYLSLVECLKFNDIINSDEYSLLKNINIKDELSNINSKSSNVDKIEAINILLQQLYAGLINKVSEKIADSKNKYLKYKNKYLQLKNKINNQ
jgi:hypothetical protein